MLKKALPLVLATLFLSLTPVYSAPSTPRLVVVFLADEAQVSITDGKGKALVAAEGLTVAPGTTIRTKATTVELRLEPNGSVLKLAPQTAFRVTSLQDLGGATTNGFQVAAGKIRMVAAKLAGVKNSYTLTTPTAQAGVRGTDFALEANPEKGDWICVKEGAVEFGPLAKGGSPAKTIVVRTGEFANVKAAVFQPKKATEADLADKFAGLDFVRVDAAAVPGHGEP